MYHLVIAHTGFLPSQRNLPLYGVCVQYAVSRLRVWNYRGTPWEESRVGGITLEPYYLAMNQPIWYDIWYDRHIVCLREPKHFSVTMFITTFYCLFLCSKCGDEALLHTLLMNFNPRLIYICIYRYVVACK